MKLMFSVVSQVTLASVVTLIFDLRSRNIVYIRSGYELNLFTKNEANPSNGLGGIREQTYRQTDKHIGYQYCNIDKKRRNKHIIKDLPEWNEHVKFQVDLFF